MINKFASCIFCTFLMSCQPSYIKVPFVKPDIQNDKLPINMFYGKKVAYNGIDGYFYDMDNLKIMATDIVNYQTMQNQCNFNQDMWVKAVEDYNKINN